VLVMLPMVAFGTLAVDSVLQYRASADVASRIERDIKTTRGMVELFRSLVNEAIAVGLEKSASEAHVPVAAIAGALGYGPAVRSTKARPATDTALASLGESSPVSAEQIRALRRHVDAQTIGSIEASSAYVELYGRITTVLVAWFSDLGQRAVQVHRGSRLAVPLGELQAATTALQYGGAQSADLSELLLSSADQETSVLVRLGSDSFRTTPPRPCSRRRPMPPSPLRGIRPRPFRTSVSTNTPSPRCSRGSQFRGGPVRTWPCSGVL
jgi:hypothetical protein